MTYKIITKKEKNTYGVYLITPNYADFRIGIFEIKPTKKDIDNMKLFVSNIIKFTSFHFKHFELTEEK